MLTINDFNNAIYALKHARGFAATVILTLGLTLGALIAMFNLNYQILAAPLPYTDETQLMVSSTSWLAKDGSVLSEGMLPTTLIKQFYHNPSDKLSLQALLGYSFNAMTLRDKADTPKVQIAYTTPGYMQMYQMPMLHGRAFSTDEDVGSQSAVAILSEQLWRRHYNADPALIGETIQLGKDTFTVIGIAAASFIEPRLLGPDRGNDLWLPWDFGPAARTQAPSAMYGWHFYLGKLKDPQQRQAFEQELRPALNSLFQDAIAAFPAQSGRSISFEAMPLRQILEGDSANRTLWMLAGSLLLMLIASANIINLLLARAARQQRTMAIQAALGAQRHHLFYAVLVELSLLLLGALLLAFGVAQLGYQLLQTYAGNALPRLSELGFNPPVLLFALAVTALLALLFAVLISRQINYRALQQSIQSSGKGNSMQVSNQTRQMLIGAQICLAAVLLICSGQVLLQAMAELQQPIGFKSQDRYQIDIDDITPEPDAELKVAAQRQRKEELSQIRDLLLAHPAVATASVSNYPPVSYDGLYAAANYLQTAADQSSMVQTHATTTDQYFLPMFGLTLLQGRNFTAQEVSTQSAVMIVNQAFAQKLQPDGLVIGRKLYTMAGAAFEIIGVVADYNLPDENSVEEPSRSFIPRNLIQGTALLLQLKPGMQIPKAQLNQLMNQVSPNFRAADLYSLEDSVARVLFRNYLAATVTAALVLLTLLLAAIGIYGVLSYSVQLRRFELGVRMAIGARPISILQQLLVENCKPVLIGLGIAMLLLSLLWYGVKQSSYSIVLSGSGFLLPLGLILLLTVMTTLLSVWGIIQKPAVHALRGQ